MVYRGAKPREAKSFNRKEVSTSESKWRRHRNKKRIWRRAVRRFAHEVIANVNVETAPLGAVSI